MRSLSLALMKYHLADWRENAAGESQRGSQMDSSNYCGEMLRITLEYLDDLKMAGKWFTHKSYTFILV